MENKKIYFIIGGIILFLVLVFISYSIIFKIQNSNNIDEYYGDLENTEIKTQKEIPDDEFSLPELTNTFSNSNDYTNPNVKKLIEDKGYVYTVYEKNELLKGNNMVNVNIPLLNINSEYAKKCNKQTQDVYVETVNSILNGSQTNVNLQVDYVAYVNYDILSVIIRASYKNQTSIQREIISTYNINLNTMEEVKLTELMQTFNIDFEEAHNKITTYISNKNKDALSLKQAGYETYVREEESEIYNIENIDSFYIDGKSNLVVVYAYGNANYTTETDLIRLKILNEIK